MNKLRIFKIATVAAPIVACVVGGGVIGTEMHRLHRLESQQADVKTQIGALERQIKESTVQAPGGRYPTANLSPDEQPTFLNALRGYADKEHIQLVRWTNVPAPPASVTPDDQKKSALPSTVTAIVSTVEAKGEYNSTRRFLYDVLFCPRLLTMNNVKWIRDAKWPATRVTFTLTRYVTTQGKA